MTPIGQYRWEATHLAIITAVVAIFALVAHLAGIPTTATRQPARAPLPNLMHVPAAGTAQPVSDSAGSPESPQSETSRQSDPHEATVGPNGISNRYRLQSLDRKKSTPRDTLVLSLHVESLATDGLVSPFESGMLEIRSPGISPIKPSTPFRSPIPSGSSRNRDVAFSIPSTLSLDRATLRIHYFNYENEIPLDRPFPLVSPSPAR